MDEGETYSSGGVEEVIHNLRDLEANLGQEIELEGAGDGEAVAGPHSAKAGPDLLLFSARSTENTTARKKKENHQRGPRERRERKKKKE